MNGKRVLLGITGGIAAYKIAFLIRLLRKSGAEVKCILTPASCDFISPLVVSTLSGNPVGIEFWNKSDGTWNNHVEYGQWADVFVIAPCTANTLSKMVAGSCDNLLLATYLSMKGNTIVAPAMDLDMYKHPSTQRNIDQLDKDGVMIIPAEEGELASGLEGQGRLAEPETIFEVINSKLGSTKKKSSYSGKTVLITAGPTYEAIDPVRFIGNHSSGKMGFSLAEVMLHEGANVILVSGPTELSLSHENLSIISIVSAQEMLQAVQQNWSTCDYGVFAAAVADYRPAQKADQKIKKKEEEINIELIRNPDVLRWAGENKSKNQVLVGFALETQNAIENANHKLKSKNLNIIVVNTMEDDGAGFSVNTNKISILDDRNNSVDFQLKSKHEVAKDITKYLKEYTE